MIIPKPHAIKTGVLRLLVQHVSFKANLDVSILLKVDKNTFSKYLNSLSLSGKGWWILMIHFVHKGVGLYKYDLWSDLSNSY